jgi:large subunit ribosomal protein L10
LAISKQRKEELVAQYVDLIQRSKALIVTEYRGMADLELKKVRRAVREANGIYRITKATLLRRALEAAGQTVPEGLSGVPIAIGFCFDNVPGVAKALLGIAKESELFILHGGLMDGQYISADGIKAVAELPPIEVLRAQILGLFDAPAANLVGVLQAGVGQVVNVIDAYSRKEAA